MKEKNIFRIGKVSNIDYENGMMQVLYTDKGQAVTAHMPYANFNQEYAMPGIGEQVLVAHLSNGSSRGVVLGSIWNKKNIPEEKGKGLYRKELSKTKGAAYVRYEDSSGEYLLAVPVLKLHGIEKTEVEGPEVKISANHRTSWESPEHTATLQTVKVHGLEGADIELLATNNIRITMDSSKLLALILKVKLETMNEMELLAGKDLALLAEGNLNLSAGKGVRLEDATFSTTLSEIMGRLEALDGNTDARK